MTSAVYADISQAQKSKLPACPPQSAVAFRYQGIARLETLATYSISKCPFTSRYVRLKQASVSSGQAAIAALRADPSHCRCSPRATASARTAA